MKNLSKNLINPMKTGISLLAYACAIICLSWVIYKLGNFLFSYFDIHLQFHFASTLVSITIISVIAIFLNLMYQSKKSSISSSSKAWQYEEDYRWFNDYMGDDYNDPMDDPY